MLIPVVAICTNALINLVRIRTFLFFPIFPYPEGTFGPNQQLLHVMFKDLRYYCQFLIICILTAFNSLGSSKTFSAMPKANGVPTATGSVNLDTKLSQMRNDIYSQVIGETKTHLKSLHTQLKDSLNGQIKKAVNEQQDSQDRVSQVMSKIKSAIQTSEAHTKSELAAQIMETVKSEVAKAMALFKESQNETRPLEPCAPAPAPAPALALHEVNNERLGIIEEKVQNLTEIVMGSLTVIDTILLSWGKQLDSEMKAKRDVFEEEWREQIDFTQQALAVQVDNLTDTHSQLQELAMIVARMQQRTLLETTDLTDYRDEPPEDVWPGLTHTPARDLQQTNVEETDTSIIDFDSDSGSETDTEKDGGRGDLPQSLTDWDAGPSLRTPGNDDLRVNVAQSNHHHNPDTRSAQSMPPSAPALVRDEPHVDTANHDRHHDPVSGFKQFYPSVRGRYTKIDPEGICLRG